MFSISPEQCFYTTLWNLKCSLCMCYHCVVKKSISKIYPTSTMAPKFARFESSWLQCVGMLRITDLDLSSIEDHGHPHDFFQGWAIRGSERRKSPSGVQRQLSGGNLGAFIKMMHKYFVYWGFRQHLQHKATLQHFQGGGTSASPLPMLAGAHVDDATDERLPHWQRDPAWPTPFSVSDLVGPD